MADACPAPDPAKPLFQGLLGSTDCHVQVLVQGGYNALTNGMLTGLLTAGLTLYVAVIGYQLMLGRSRATISDFALSAVKLGVIVTLTTQWPLYERVVYDLLFHGPQELADLIQRDAAHRGAGLIASLQHAFDDLSLFTPLTPPGPAHHDPNASVSLPTWQLQNMSPAAREASLFLVSAFILLITTLGVLLAAKIILGFLLAAGPLFIGFFLFENTRGIFSGWLRASVAAALVAVFTPAAMGLFLTLVQPALAQIEQMDKANTYIPGVGMQVFILVMVMAAATVGLVVGAVMIGMGLRLPTPPKRARQPQAAPASTQGAEPALPSRAARLASTVAAQDRTRMRLADAGRSDDRAAASPIGSSYVVQTRSEVRRIARPNPRPSGRPRR